MKPSAFRPFRALLRDWLLSFLGWGLVAAAVGAQIVHAFSMTWTEAVLPGMRDWLPWAVLTPLLFRLTERLPLDRQHWRLSAPVHLLTCAAVMTAVGAWSGMVREWEHHGERFEKRPGPPPGERRERLREGGAPLHSFPPPRPPESRRERRGPGGPPPDPGGRFSPSIFDLMLRLPVYLAILGAAHAQVFHRRSQERAAGLVRARLEALSLQLQPHFLFNTLNTIAGLVHEEPDKADAMLTALSDLLRFSLETSGEVELPLQRDLEAVRRYLEIMQVRFEERLQYEIDAPPDTLAAMAPAFLLQPLVENAVLHGVESCAGQRGKILIQARRRGNHLFLTVSDNGPGLADGAPLREGIGLANTRERLRELYGGMAQLELCSAENPAEDEPIKPTETAGCTVWITLPFHAADPVKSPDILT